MAVVSLGVIGTGVTDGTDVVSIPVTVDVPRSDPAGGASIVIVIPFITDTGISVISVGDDAATDPFYSTHLYTDGMNPPYVRRSAPNLIGHNGLILNPLTASVDTITIQLSSGTTFGAALAFAYTGVQVNNQSNPTYQVPDQPTLNWFDWLHIPSPFGLYGGNPYPGLGTSRFLEYSFDPVALLEPPFTTYPNWSIHDGSIAVYFASSSPFTTVAPDDFTPSDVTWTELGAMVNVATPPPVPPYVAEATFSIWEKPLSPPELNGDLDGTFTTATSADMFGAVGGGITLLAGLGPIWLVAPPAANYPVFMNAFRAGTIASSGSGPMDA